MPTMRAPVLFTIGLADRNICLDGTQAYIPFSYVRLAEA